jgi:hypothetical protein
VGPDPRLFNDAVLWSAQPARGVTTGIKATVDALGKLTHVRLLPGQARDLRAAALLEGLTRGQCRAGGAFEADWVRAAPVGQRIVGAISPRSARRFPAGRNRAPRPTGVPGSGNS